MDANRFCHQSQVFLWTPWSRNVGSERLAWLWWFTQHQCYVSAMKWTFFPHLSSTEPMLQGRA